MDHKFQAYILIAPNPSQVLVKCHINFEKCKNDKNLRSFAKSLAKSFCNFQRFCGEEFLIDKLVKLQPLESPLSSTDFSANRQKTENLEEEKIMGFDTKTKIDVNKL